MTIGPYEQDHWNQMPVDIQAEICSYLSKKDILALRETCLKTNETVYLMPIFKEILDHRVPYLTFPDKNLQEVINVDRTLQKNRCEKIDLWQTRDLQKSTVGKCQETMLQSIYTLAMQGGRYVLSRGWSCLMASVQYPPIPATEEQMKILESLYRNIPSRGHR